MKKRPSIGFLIVSGDGSRVIRLSVPRWALYGAMGAIGLAAVTMTGLSGGFLVVKSQAGELWALRQEVSRQQATIGTFVQRVAAVRGEINSWKKLHARMRQPFGPEHRPAEEATGVGGPHVDEDRAVAEGTHAALGEELDLLTSSISEEGPRLRELEVTMSKNARIMAALPLRWPVRGRVNSEFGLRRNPWGGASKEHHGGIDIGVPYGEPIKAPAAGRVVVAGPRGEYGNSVILDHGNDVRSVYGHMSKVLVRAGSVVQKGQVVGLAGSTGRSTGTHLHYEVQVQGRPVNPRSFLWD